MTTEWASQVNAMLADLARRVERLDTHSAEMARELLDGIERLDRLQGRLAAVEATVGREVELSHALEDDVDERALAEQRALAGRVADLEARLSERIERITARLERSLDALERRVDNHETQHWQEGRR